jgi:DNA-binding transcriptional ArsR family regulator
MEKMKEKDQLFKGEKERSIMHNQEGLTRIFKTLGNENRLRILQSIEKGVSNPGEMSRDLDMPRSTVEKHLRVLLKARMVEKVPNLNPEGQLRVYYRVSDATWTVLDTAKKIFKIEK